MGIHRSSQCDGSVENTAQSKLELRKNIQARRDQITASARQIKDQKIANSCEILISTYAVSRLGLYVNFRSEPDLFSHYALLNHTSPGVDIGLPRIENDGDLSARHMSFYLWKKGDALIRNSRGILEPNPDPNHLVTIWPSTSMLIIPCLAADRHGIRLGYGGGFYDQYLSRMVYPAICKVGVCYDDFFFADKLLPNESHDIKLDWVVTEFGIIQCSSAKV